MDHKDKINVYVKIEGLGLPFGDRCMKCNLCLFLMVLNIFGISKPINGQPFVSSCNLSIHPTAKSVRFVFGSNKQEMERRKVWNGTPRK